MRTGVHATILKTISGRVLPAVPIVLLTTLSLLVSMTGCDSGDTGIIDPSLTVPYLSSFDIAPQFINTDTIGVDNGVEPGDSILIGWDITLRLEPRGARIAAVEYTVRSQFQQAPVTTGTLSLPASLDAESVTIRQRIGVHLLRTDVGRYTITLSAITADGLSSNKISRTAEIVRNNQPPVILDVDVPDTLTVTATTPFDIIVTVDDPDGVEDVVRVHFYSVNPNGNRGITPFVLERIEPGIFGSRFQVEPTNTKGTYTFEFQAFDRLGEESEIYEHRLTLQ
jgi:hypothetical protein